MRISYREYFILMLSLLTSVSLRMQELAPSTKRSCILKLRRKFDSDCSRTYIWLVAVLVLCAIFLLLYYFADLHKNHVHQEEALSKFMRSSNATRVKLATTMSGCTYEDCSVVCANSSDLSADLVTAVQESYCIPIEVIHIERQNFPNHTLEKNWITNHTTFSELIIANSNLTTIKNEAFNNEAFTATFSVSLLGLPIRNLSAGTLLGLSKLEYLTVGCELMQIDRGFFQPVSASLRFLKLHYMAESVQFDTIFGISKMTSLVHLDLSSNNFGSPITMQGFRRLSKVEFLNLSNSKITSIGEDAFKPIMDTLKYLDLSYNHLRSVNPNTFESILSSGIGYIYLGENPWFCDCNLQALIDYLENYPERFLDRPYCKYPRKFYGSKISEKIFCQKETTTGDGIPKQSTAVSRALVEKTSPATPIIPSTRNSSIEPAEGTYTTELSSGITPTAPGGKRNFFTLFCAKQKEVQPSVYTTNDFDYLKFLPPLHNFSIFLINNTAVKIVIEELESRFSILWHSDSDDANSMYVPEPEYGCQTLPNTSVIIGNLKDNLSYTFCLISEGEISITPFNCQPFHVPVVKSSESKGWITHDKKHIILATIIVVLFASTCTGGVVSYFLIKNYPDLLRGSKHVVIVKKSTLPCISTISRKEGIPRDEIPVKCRKKITPPPPYQSETDNTDTESTYENPEDVKGYETPRRHTYNFDKCEFIDISPKSPPPLPKRNSEPTNKILDHNKICQYQTRI